jgi:hypothetical protein
MRKSDFVIVAVFTVTVKGHSSSLSLFNLDSYLFIFWEVVGQSSLVLLEKTSWINTVSRIDKYLGIYLVPRKV